MNSVFTYIRVSLRCRNDLPAPEVTLVLRPKVKDLFTLTFVLVPMT